MNYLKRSHIMKELRMATNIYHVRFIQSCPETMQCLAISNYGKTLDHLQYQMRMKCPTEKDLLPDQALVKVLAASVNPFDIEMTRGYGRNALNLFRKFAGTSEFPLILGRDCSGYIVARGKRFRRFKIGEAVNCVRWISGQGTHAEYVIVQKSEVSLKPQNVSFIEAASLPYVACTTWSALVNSGVVPTSGKAKRIFIPGGSGGVGSFATQLCIALGHDVVTTCNSDAVKDLQNLGIKNVIDYKADTYLSDLENAGPFDIIYDTLNEVYIDTFTKFLKQNPFSRYVSLRPSLLSDTDTHGIMLGTMNAGTKLVRSAISQMSSGRGGYHWGFFNPNALILDQIRPYVESGQIKPFIDRTFPFHDIISAYRYVEKGHARGKTVIKVVD